MPRVLKAWLRRVWNFIVNPPHPGPWRPYPPDEKQEARDDE
jgi:hypothetical protein